MGEKDISEKILLDYNDVFADIINVCVFNGNENIKAEELENTSVHAQYKAEDGKLHEEEREIANFFVQKRKNKDYIPDDKREMKHVDAVLKLLSVMTKDASYRELLYHDADGKGEVRTMCEVAERLKAEGKREVYLSQIKTKLAKNKNFEQIADELELTIEEVEELIQFLQSK